MGTSHWKHQIGSVLLPLIHTAEMESDCDSPAVSVVASRETTPPTFALWFVTFRFRYTETYNGITDTSARFGIPKDLVDFNLVHQRRVSFSLKVTVCASMQRELVPEYTVCRPDNVWSG